MIEKRWPVSDREIKPWWFHALNWTSAALLLPCAAIALMAASVWLGHLVGLGNAWLSARKDDPMNVRDLIERLSRLDPNLPVVMQQSDEPLGSGYEVLDVDIIPGQPDNLYHASAPTHGGRPWDYPQVWNTYDGGDAEVVMLGSDKPWRPTIDGELAHRELT